MCSCGCATPSVCRDVNCRCWQLCRRNAVRCSHSESLMSVALQSGRSFHNRDMTERTMQISLDASGLEPNNTCTSHSVYTQQDLGRHTTSVRERLVEQAGARELSGASGHSIHCWACGPLHRDTDSVSSLVVKVSKLIHLYPARDILGHAVLNFLNRFTPREVSMVSAFNPGHLSLVEFTCKLGSS